MIKGIIYKYASLLGRHYNTALGFKWKYKESSTTISKESSAKWREKGSIQLDEDIVLTTCIYKDVEVHKRTA